MKYPINRISFTKFIVCATLLLLFFIPAYSQQSSSTEIHDNIFITSADGTKLATTLALPGSGGTFPTVVMRSPYGVRAYKGMLEGYAKRGYACLLQDTRGRYDSEGYFDPFVYGIEDGDATLAWIRSQEWSNGIVCAQGHSYNGFTSLYLVAGEEEPPAAVVVSHPVASPAGGLYRGGAMLHHFDYYWSLLVDGKTQDLDYIFSLDWDRLFGILPLVDAHKEFNTEIRHYHKWIDWANGSFGKGELPEPSMIPGEKTAFLLVGGWFDLFGRDVINLFNQLSADSPKGKVKLIIGPFDHSLSPPPDTDMEFGEWSSLNIGDISNQWMDHWVKGTDNGVEKRPAVEFFLLGENRWISTDSWPPAGAVQRSYFLHSKGSANTSDGDGVLDEHKPGDEPADNFVYDPGNPVPTKGGSICCLRQMTKAGPYDHAYIEKRSDVLVYTTGALTKNITVAGPVELELYASTNARDTDFTGKLVDVYPDGKAVNITDGIIRARYRNGMGAPDFVTPGDVVRYRIELGPAGITFLKGHRIRLEVSSSNFPRFDRNLNTGGPIGKESAFVKAEQHVYHTVTSPSRLILTVAEGL